MATINFDDETVDNFMYHAEQMGITNKASGLEVPDIQELVYMISRINTETLRKTLEDEGIYE